MNKADLNAAACIREIADETVRFWSAVYHKHGYVPRFAIVYPDIFGEPHYINLEPACCAVHAAEVVERLIDKLKGRWVITVGDVHTQDNVMSFDGKLLPLTELRSGMLVTATGPGVSAYLFTPTDDESKTMGDTEELSGAEVGWVSELGEVRLADHI